MVLNTGPLDWGSSTLTTRPLLHEDKQYRFYIHCAEWIVCYYLLLYQFFEKRNCHCGIINCCQDQVTRWQKFAFAFAFSDIFLVLYFIRCIYFDYFMLSVKYCRDYDVIWCQVCILLKDHVRQMTFNRNGQFCDFSH